MKRSNIVMMVVVILVIAVMFIFYFAGKDSGKGDYNWEKTYNDGLQQPYDFGVIKSLIEKRTSAEFRVVEKNLRKHVGDLITKDSATYLFLGQYSYLNKKELDTLITFAAVGHQVVFICEGLPDTLFKALSYYSKPIYMDRFDEAEVRVTTPNYNSRLQNYSFKYRGYKGSNPIIDWNYLNEDKQLGYYYDNTGNRYVEMGRINDKLNFAKFKVGSGFIFIHTSPMLLSNYALRKDTGLIYANEVFSSIETKYVIYDIGSRVYKPDSEQIQRQSDSPLTYILSKPALRAAWYLFILTVVLFFLFRAKRNQRIIPVLEQKRNTSVRFIDTISGLFFNNANHRQMVDIKMNLFLFFIRHRLRIPTRDLSEETYHIIAVRSKVPVENVRSIFSYYDGLKNYNKDNVESINLLEFYQRISTFYEIYNQKK